MEKLIKYFFCLWLILIFNRCSVNRNLVYTLPLEIEKIVYLESKKLNHQGDIYFELKNLDDEINIFIIPTNNLKNEKFGYLKVINSNRLIRINNKLYHLVFSSDEKYGTIINDKYIQSIEEREKLIENYKEDEIQGIKRRHTIYDNAIFLKFKNGKLINHN